MTGMPSFRSAELPADGSYYVTLPGGENVLVRPRPAGLDHPTASKSQWKLFADEQAATDAKVETKPARQRRLHSLAKPIVAWGLAASAGLGVGATATLTAAEHLNHVPLVNHAISDKVDVMGSRELEFAPQLSSLGHDALAIAKNAVIIEEVVWNGIRKVL